LLADRHTPNWTRAGSYY